MATPRDFVYSFGNVIVLLDGEQVTGFAEGDDVVIVTPNADRVTKVTGADGWTTFNLSEDNTAEIQLKLLPTSPSNGLLNVLFDTFVATKVIQGSTIVIKDNSANDLWVAENFVISGPPPAQRGGNNGEHVWSIMTGSLQTTLSGF